MLKLQMEGYVSQIAALCGGLVVIALCSVVLALTLRITHWIRAHFAQSREITLCFLVATWSLFSAIVVFAVGLCATSMLGA